MLKLKDMYQLPSTVVPLANYFLNEKWMKEVPELEYHVPYSALQSMDKDGMLTVREVAHQNFDGERSAGIYTLWFNGSPVGIFHTSGRGGDEYVDRWITDATTFALACQYVRNMLNEDDAASDVHDPERVVYPEEMFVVYGTDFGPQFGHPAEKTADGIMPFFRESLIPGVDHKMTLVTAEPKYSPMPEYLRRHQHVFQRVREVSAEEHALNTQLALVSAEEGHTQFYWYTECERPENAEVLAV